MCGQPQITLSVWPCNLADCNAELITSQPLSYLTKFVFPFMHAVLPYSFSVKTRLKGLLDTPSLDNCVHTHTTFNCCSKLHYSHYQRDSSATVNDMCVIYGAELCGESLILRCCVFYGLINKSCSASRCRCFAPITIHPQCKSTQHYLQWI